MTKNAETGALDVAHGADQFFRLEPRIVEIAQINVRELFNIDSSTGAVTFITAPNYEAPTDAGANNVYNIDVIASDGENL